MLGNSPTIRAQHYSSDKSCCYIDSTETAGKSCWDVLKHKDSIRLLKLSREFSTGTLRFELSEHRSASLPRYVAISYIWGEEGDVGLIKNQKGCYPLRRNLLALLSSLEARMRRGELNRNTYLWIDALCIDQHSTEEKEQQVERISQTFFDAEQVWCWLGTTHGQNGCLEIFSEHQPRISAGTAIDSHHYWTRAWIVQEFILAHEIVLFDRDHWISGQRFIDSIPATVEEYSLDETGLDAIDINAYYCSSMIHIVNSRRAARTRILETTKSLLQLVTAFGELQCTDPRDKLYSLLSLYEGDLDIKVDYDVSVACLFWRIVLAERVKRSWRDICELRNAMRLKLCDLLPSQYVWNAAPTDRSPNTSSNRITDHEWQQDAILKSHHFVQVFCSRKDITADMLPMWSTPINAPWLDDSKSTRRVLCGEIRLGDQTINPPGAEISFVVREEFLICNDTWSLQILAIMAPGFWKGANDADLSSVALMRLLKTPIYADIRRNHGECCIYIKKIDFVSLLTLDSDLHDVPTGCCTMLYRE